MSSSSPSYQPSPEAASASLPPLPEKRIVLGCGGVCMDFLAVVAAFPKPGDKIRSTTSKVQGGGNAANTLTCAARLGLNPRFISKVADDARGRAILEELKADGVDTSYIVVLKEGNSPFTYVIVDSQTKTRTCIFTPGNPRMVPDDLSQTSLSSALDDARFAYFDGRLQNIALIVAQEAWTKAPSMPSALVSILLRLPNVKFVIVILGVDGCIMLDRCVEVSNKVESRWDWEDEWEVTCRNN